MNKFTSIMIAVLSFLFMANAILGAYNSRVIREHSRDIADVKNTSTMLVSKYYWHLSDRIDRLEFRVSRIEEFVRKNYRERSVSPVVFPEAGWYTGCEVTTNMPALGKISIQLCSEERR